MPEDEPKPEDQAPGGHNLADNAAAEDHLSRGPADHHLSDSAETKDSVRVLTSDEQIRGDRLIDFVLSKWGEDKTCPYCGATNWMVDPVPKPPFLRLYSILCQNCGVVTLLHAEVTGIEPPT